MHTGYEQNSGLEAARRPEETEESVNGNLGDTYYGVNLAYGGL